MKKLLFAAIAICASLGSTPQAMAQMVNAQTGTTYTFAAGDCDPGGKKMITFNNAASVAVTLPAAGVSGQFLSGCIITAKNIGLGSVTITPTTSTIDGQTTFVLASGASAMIYTDATPATATGNYWTNAGNMSANGLPPTNFRNFVHNGAFQVQQRGTGEQTCAANAALVAANYVADRWGCIVNVGSGAGFAKAVATGGPTTNLPNHMQVYRKTGALLQPVCMVQAVQSADVKALAGNTVTLSFYALGLANMLADSPLLAVYLVYGTGTDQGYSTAPTASPAITPAWTGVNATLTKNVTLTSAFQRFTYTAALPSTATEVGIQMCWTPTLGTGFGITDGFDVGGVQLEQGGFATPFEQHPFALDLQIAEQFYWQVNDVAATIAFPSVCNVTTANTTVKCSLILPAAMRAIPTGAVTTATSFGIWLTAGTAGTCTTLAVATTASTTQTLGLTCTTAGTIALGAGTALIGAATGATNLITASADL